MRARARHGGTATLKGFLLEHECLGVARGDADHTTLPWQEVEWEMVAHTLRQGTDDAVQAGVKAAKLILMTDGNPARTLGRGTMDLMDWLIEGALFDD